MPRTDATDILRVLQMLSVLQRPFPETKLHPT